MVVEGCGCGDRGNRGSLVRLRNAQKQDWAENAVQTTTGVCRKESLGWSGIGHAQKPSKAQSQRVTSNILGYIATCGLLEGTKVTRCAPGMGHPLPPPKGFSAVPQTALLGEMGGKDCGQRPSWNKGVFWWTRGLGLHCVRTRPLWSDPEGGGASPQHGGVVGSVGLYLALGHYPGTRGAPRGGRQGRLAGGRGGEEEKANRR